MNTIGKDVIVEQEINKSSFITYLKLVTTPLDAKNYIKEIKELHPNATHHVTAYLVGPTGEHGHANDDGEPSGTAGLPVLDVFKKNDITNFVCIVVRYFGGIKLGAGGLVRAYSSSASLALKEAGTQPIINYQTLELTFNYGFMNIIENKLKNYEIVSKGFTTNVTLTIKVPESDITTLKEILITLTNNQIIIK
ncbi:MAG: YigZ family protein [Erysipelotrichaceae bacterium]|nr:YigZ family protein [Erysipelotrichaceae bacterium]